MKELNNIVIFFGLACFLLISTQENDFGAVMKRLLVFSIVFIVILVVNSFADAAVKIRDLARVEGIRDNQLFGYGLVVGLNGSGDKTGTEFTIQSLVNMLDRMGITVSQNNVKVKNVAAVMVTAKLPPFSKAGNKIDITVSSIGDAKSLEGGTLLLTPLSAANGQIYAVAQGPLSVGGMNVAAAGAGVVKNHPTVGMIPDGAIVEKEIPFNLEREYFILAFGNLGIADIVQSKAAINSFLGTPIATILTPTTVRVDVPEEFRENFYDFMSSLLNIEIQPETFARVIVDERTGTIVMGSDVRISTVAVAHGNLTITITNSVEVSQPNPLSLGQTVVTENTQIQVAEEKSKLMIVPDGVTISDLVKALNAIGVTPRDLISILQAIKAAGALHADLELM